jgi:transposase
VNKKSDTIKANPWLLEVAYDIRDDAIKDVLTALKGNSTKMKGGQIDKFQMQFRSKKKQKSETFYLRSRWIVQKKEHFDSQTSKNEAYYFLDRKECLAWSHLNGL